MELLKEYLKLYHVDDSGNVTRNGRKLKWRNYKGYPFVRLWNGGGVSKDFAVHRLVAILYVPNPDNLPVVNHKNGDKWDPRKENVEWCTYSYNSQHSYDELEREACKGTENGNSKLLEGDVREIRKLLEVGGLKHQHIAEMFGVTKTTVSKIKSGKLWKWLV